MRKTIRTHHVQDHHEEEIPTEPETTGFESATAVIAAPSTDAATPADAAAAQGLIPASAALVRRGISSKCIDVFANPAMQRKLESIAPDLSNYKGCDIPTIVKLANEGQQLLGTHQRLGNSLGRVHQRLVQINGRLREAQTALLTAADAAPPGSAIAEGLTGLVGLRAAEIANAKATRTRNAAKKAKKPMLSLPKPGT